MFTGLFAEGRTIQFGSYKVAPDAHLRLYIPSAESNANGAAEKNRYFGIEYQSRVSDQNGAHIMILKKYAPRVPGILTWRGKKDSSYSEDQGGNLKDVGQFLAWRGRKETERK